MMIRSLLILGFLVSGACQLGSPSSRPQDVITDLEQGQGTYIYYKRDSRLYRSLCADGEVNPSRERCTEQIAHVDYDEFGKRLAIGVGAGLDQKQEAASEWFVKLTRLDQQMSALISNDSEEADAVREQVRNAETKVADLAVDIADTKAEVFEAKRAYALEPNDDLAKQILELENTLRKLEEQALAADTELVALRKQLVELRSAVSDQDTFDALQTRFGEVESAYDSARGEVEVILADLISFNRLQNLLLNANFAFEIVNGSASFADLKPHVARMFATFNVLREEQRQNAPVLEVVDGEVALPDTEVTLRTTAMAAGTKIQVKVDGAVGTAPDLAFSEEFKVAVGSADSRSCGDHRIEIKIVDDEGFASAWSEARTVSVTCWTDKPTKPTRLYFQHHERSGSGTSRSIRQESVPAWATSFALKHREDGSVATLPIDQGSYDQWHVHPHTGTNYIAYQDGHGYVGPFHAIRVTRFPAPWANDAQGFEREEIEPMEAKIFAVINHGTTSYFHFSGVNLSGAVVPHPYNAKLIIRHSEGETTLARRQSRRFSERVRIRSADLTLHYGQMITDPIAVDYRVIVRNGDPTIQIPQYRYIIPDEEP